MKTLKFFFVIIIFSQFLSAQKIHTVYLDNKKKAVFSSEFSTYVLKYSDYSMDSNLRRYRVNYSTGEVYADGIYNIIDTLNFDSSDLGNSTFYYKDGQVQKEIVEINKSCKVVNQFYSNGLLASIDTLYNGKNEGNKIIFDKENRICEIHNYHNGSPTLPFYIVKDLKMNTESAFYNNTNNPYFFSVPAKSFQTVDIEDLGNWEIYDNNYMLLAMQWQKLKDHGKYHQVWISITNYSTLPIEFDPQKIIAFVYKDFDNVDICELHQLNIEEYQHAISKLGFWDYFAIGLTGLATGLANQQEANMSNYAGYSSGFINNTYYQNFDATSAIIGKQIINNRINYRNALFQDMIMSDANSRHEEAQMKTVAYLTKTVIQPGQQILGFVNFKYEKGVSLCLQTNINGINYDFVFDISEGLKNFKQDKYKVFDVMSNSPRTVTVRGIKKNDIIEILNTKGELLQQREATGNEMSINLREGIYIIRVGDKYKRVMVREND